jgi:hypothetical protein
MHPILAAQGAASVEMAVSLIVPDPTHIKALVASIAEDLNDDYVDDKCRKRRILDTLERFKEMFQEYNQKYTEIIRKLTI